MFAPAIGAEEPKPRFAYVFPGKNEALIQARLRPDSERLRARHAIDMIREAVASPAFSLKSASYVVTGDPVVRDGVAAGLSHQAAVLLVAAALLVAVALALAFGGPFPLLPLAGRARVAALAFGLGPSCGRLAHARDGRPAAVLIALAAAFAALLQARATRTEAARLVTAGLVTAAGLVALLVARADDALLRRDRDRGCGARVRGDLTAGVAAQALLKRLPAGRFRLGRRDGSIASAAPCSARRSGARGGPSGSRSSRPARMGGGYEGRGRVGSRRGSRRRISRRFETPPSCGTRRWTEGQVSVLVHGKDLADPSAIAWMSRYQGRVLVRHGYSERKSCRKAEICPALALTNVFGSIPRTELQARAAIRSLPAYFARSVITPDRRTASIGFVLSKMSADRREAVIDDLRAQLDPPAGVTAEVAGQPVSDAATRSDLESSRWTLGLAALLLAFAVLLAIYRKVEQAIVPLVPAVLATGWTALAVWVLQVPLNPISAALGAILIALGSGLGSLLAARYAEARASGRSPADALSGAWGAAGAEVAVPVVVLAAGFLALTVSDFKVLHDFGAVALTGLALELTALMLVLPATLLVAEEGVSLRAPKARAAALGLVRATGRGVRFGLARVGRVARAAAAGVRRASPSKK